MPQTLKGKIGRGKNRDRGEINIIINRVLLLLLVKKL
jgi:hypothetical protein